MQWKPQNMFVTTRHGVIKVSTADHKDFRVGFGFHQNNFRKEFSISEHCDKGSRSQSPSKQAHMETIYSTYSVINVYSCHY